MKTRSAKAKGKRLEKWICERLLELFDLTDDDIRVTIGQEGGNDVKLSKKAQLKFPYSIEAKNREAYTAIYKAYEQAKSHSNLEPIVVIKMNRQKPLVILDAEYYFNLVKELNGRKT